MRHPITIERRIRGRRRRHQERRARGRLAQYEKWLSDDDSFIKNFIADAKHRESEGHRLYQMSGLQLVGEGLRRIFQGKREE